jgi:hypothetical protein
VEVSSSNFPRFDRNLNSGGTSYDEATGLVAHNTVHHSRQYPSSVTITVVPGNPAGPTQAGTSARLAVFFQSDRRAGRATNAAVRFLS